jgi:GDPmannose 4,6-dehydratase
VHAFVERAAQHLGMNIVWNGSGIDEIGIDTRSQKVVVRVDPHYFGDASKARRVLGLEAGTDSRATGRRQGK